MRMVGKGFSGVETPLFEYMLAVRAVDAEEEVQVPAQDDVVQEHVTEEIATETTNAAQQLEIIKLKAKVKKLERLNKVKSSKLRRLKKGRISVDMETDEGVELVVDQEKDAEIEGRHAGIQAEIYNIDLDHSSKVAAASTPILAAKPKILKIATAAPAVSTRRRKGVVIRDPKEELHIDTPAETPTEELDKEHGEAYKNIDWNVAFDYVQSKETQYIKIYHGFKNKPQSESKARKNMISYLKNTKGYKMEFFKGKTYDQILPIFQARFDANTKFLFKTREEMEKEDEEIIESINETPTQKAAKRRKLRCYLEESNECSWFSIGEKIEAADFMWCTCFKMAFFKRKTYDQILLIFQARFDANIRFLFKTRKEMDKEEEEIIKSINETPTQKAAKRRRLREQAKKDENLKKQLEVVVDEDDDVFIEATPIGRKVPVKYPLSRFTLEQLVNVARLQVEEESEMSLELLRFTRQQLLEYQQSNVNTARLELKLFGDAATAARMK
nr:hypothetical protein [Tanacetum cinerariifolium]